MSKQIILNDEQNIAVKTILDFINKPAINDSDYFMTLIGYAGTGKTTIINEIIKQVRGKKLVVSATTNKAKKVIGRATNLPAETIQSLLGLRPNIELTDFNPNKPVFEIKAEEKLQYYKVVFIDEISMANKDAINLIEIKALEYGVKIIYIGDIFQLPPVNEKISKAFLLPNQVKLETIVRQDSSNPNQKLIELARNDVRDNTDTFLKYIQEIKLDKNLEEGFESLMQDEFYKRILENYFDVEYQQNPDICKTIAWTNKSVFAINRYIRKKLINSEDAIAVGDILMGYSSITKELKVPPYYINIVENSEDYIVEKVTIINQKIFGVDLKGYKVIVKDARLPMFILHKDSYDIFIMEYQDRLQKGKEFRQWKSFYDFKDQIVCMEDILDSFGSLVCKKDIDYGYAITVHKSQGSTYENVGVVLKDILKNRTPEERRKLIYVAVSRTSKLNLLYA